MANIKDNPEEKIIGEIRLETDLSFKNDKCDPVNFNALKIFSVSCLNLDVVVLKLLVKKSM